ncbi:MAG: hypothetical protein EXQ71_12425, partial [Acidimicrobiia bacterium]|nr:hypothetical protein [Acidimicrobiia bacterium]
MKNPLKDLSRAKALGIAAVAAGVLAFGGSAAAMSVGLINSSSPEPFSPEDVVVTDDTPTAAVDSPLDVAVDPGVDPDGSSPADGVEEADDLVDDATDGVNDDADDADEA